jgi:hypothetical protein|tara:strand:+ start:1633 stop:1893 length:261 start_codon:yes stop_codon:yes gene_type:complete
MRLPIIKHLVTNDSMDAVTLATAVDVLIELSEARGVKDEEMDAIGELVSNCEGAIAVMEDITKNNTSIKDALNGFMKRVIGSTDHE